MNTAVLGRVGLALRKNYQPGDLCESLEVIRHEKKLWGCIRMTRDEASEESPDWMVLFDSPDDALGVGFPVGTSLDWRFRPVQLPAGWYHENGDRFAEGTPQYKVLDSFTPEFKADNGITLELVDGKKTLALPNAYHTDGRGMFRRPGTPVGSIVPDTFQGHGHTLGNGNRMIAAGGGTAGVMQEAVGTATTGWLARDIITDGVNGTPRIGSETAGLHVLLTPAIYLGVPR